MWFHGFKLVMGVDNEGSDNLNNLEEWHKLGVEVGRSTGTGQVHQHQWRIQDLPEGAPTPGRGGRQPIIWPIFPENCMKIKKFWAGGGGRVPRNSM